MYFSGLPESFIINTSFLQAEREKKTILLLERKATKQNNPQAWWLACSPAALCPSWIGLKPPSKKVSANPCGHTELQTAFPDVRTSPQGAHTAAFAHGQKTHPAGERWEKSLIPYFFSLPQTLTSNSQPDTRGASKSSMADTGSILLLELSKNLQYT